MMCAAALTAALLAAPAHAQWSPDPTLADGETLEVEVRGDLNADGHPDLAYIAKAEDKRALRVVTTNAGEFDIDLYPVQALDLDPYPLGSAELTINGNVLLLKDLTGGTTAVDSIHRFRWDAKLAAMRLIGLDATLYSRTFVHDGAEASWNLLTGALQTQTLRLRRDGGDIAYDKVDGKRVRKASKPVRLENAISAEDLLGWPGGGR